MDSQEKKPSGAKTLSTREIFGEDKVVMIEHENSVYRLMITRQGKLVLNK